MDTASYVHPISFNPELVSELFAGVLGNVVVFEQNTDLALVIRGINTHINHMKKVHRETRYLPFENAPAAFRREITPLYEQLVLAELALAGYPLSFSDMSFLATTKKFPNGTWPAFYLLDHSVGNTFAIKRNWNDSPTLANFRPNIFPTDLLQHYTSSVTQVNNALRLDEAIATGNVVPMPKWARDHVHRAIDNCVFCQILIVGEAASWIRANMQDLYKGIGDLRVTDPIVVGRVQRRYTVGNIIEPIVISKYFVITAYDPTQAEIEVLKAYTKITPY